MRKLSWTMLAACVLLGACAEGTPAELPVSELRGAEDGPRAVRSLFDRPMHYSGIGERMREPVATEARLDALWARAWQGTTPAPGRPAVNLGSDAVVFVAMGGRSSGGYGIRVDSAVAVGQELRVYVTESSPGRSCYVPAVITAPADAVVIPGGAGLAVRFHERSVTRDCD
jgi:hypothetical protein